MRLDELLCGHCAVTALRVTEDEDVVGLEGIAVRLQERSCQPSEISHRTSCSLFVEIRVNHLIGDAKSDQVGIYDRIAFGSQQSGECRTLGGRLAQSCVGVMACHNKAFAFL